MDMTLLGALLLFVAAFLSGAVNAVAGGGTFIAFGALTLAGVPPITANATSSVTQFPGYVTSTFAYLAEIRAIWHQAVLLMLASAIGAVAGAMILLRLDNPSFRTLVPWLLIAATVVFAAGPWLKPKRTGVESVGQGGNTAGPLVQFITAVYGGFFGAGMGIMMLATLGLTERGDYHRLNALKNLLSIGIAAVAIIIFASNGVVSWLHAIIMVPAVALGGYYGVWTAKRLPQPAVRGFVIAIGLLLAAYYFVTG